MLVHLRSESSASDVLNAAKNLRRSDDREIAEQVYINPDLSPAEAELAFRKRQQRRAARNHSNLPAATTPVRNEGPSDPADNRTTNVRSPITTGTGSDRNNDNTTGPPFRSN